MNEVKTVFGIIPGINSDNERVSGVLSMTSYDDCPIFHFEVETDKLLIIEQGLYSFGGAEYNARCGDLRHDYYLNIPPELANIKNKSEI